MTSAESGVPAAPRGSGAEQVGGASLPPGPRPLTRRNVITRLVLLAILIGASLWMLLRDRTDPLGPSHPDPLTWTGSSMGTVWTLKLAEPAPATLTPGAGVQAALDTVEAAMSTWDPQTELSRFNRAPANQPFQLSKDTLEVISLAQQVSEKSGGAFDATIGPLIEAWGFNTGRSGSWSRPSPQALAEARARVDYRKLSLDLAAGTVTKADAQLRLDLSAVAKGFAVDEAAAWLETQGIARYMVEVGGEVRALGTNAAGHPWTIGIERPHVGETGVDAVVELREGALATSGTYRNFHASDGQHLSHMVDPRHGAPVQHDTVSVSVRAPDCASADAWATALLVLGSDEGVKLAETLGIAALFVDHENGALARTATSTFGPFEVVDSP